MGRKCQACGAGKDPVLFPNMSMFRFPKEEARCRQWIENAGLTHLLKKVSFDSFQNMRLCPRHFTEDQFVNHFRNSLNWFAVPTLFEEEEVARPKVKGATPSNSNNVEPDISIPNTRSRRLKAFEPTASSTVQAPVVPVIPKIVPHLPPNITKPAMTPQQISMVLNNRTKNRSSLEINDAIRLLNMFKTSKVYTKANKDSTNLQTDINASVSPPPLSMESLPCRVCGEKNWDMISIFDTEGYRIQLLDKIHLHLPIRVGPSDAASLKLCRSCVNRLQGFHQMYEKCAELTTSVSIKDPEPVNVQKLNAADSSSSVKCEVMEGVDDDPDDPDEIRPLHIVEPMYSSVSLHSPHVLQ